MWNYEDADDFLFDDSCMCEWDYAMDDDLEMDHLNCFASYLDYGFWDYDEPFEMEMEMEEWMDCFEPYDYKTWYDWTIYCHDRMSLEDIQDRLAAAREKRTPSGSFGGNNSRREIWRCRRPWQKYTMKKKRQARKRDIKDMMKNY